MDNHRRNPQRGRPSRPSNMRTGDVDLSSRSRRPVRKKHNARRITANIIGSLMLVISLITLSGMLMLSMRPFTGSDAAEKKDEELHGVIDVSDNENVAYILVLGVDKSEALADVMMVVCFDIKNNTANMLQLPRDIYVGTEIATGRTAKLNATFGSPRKNESRVNALKRTLNNQLGLPIDHHVIINIDALKEIVDAVGGVPITLEKKLTLEDFRTGKRTVKIGPGKVTLDGNKAESFMRERKSYVQGDIGRMKAQRSFYAGFASKMMSMSISQMTSIATKCFDKIQTDMSIGEALGYAKVAKKLNLESIGIHSVPGSSMYYKPPGYSRSYSYFSVDVNKYIDLVYEFMNPYGDINYEGINVQQLHSGQSTDTVDGVNLGDLE